jgi:hypothetical protein
MELEQGLENAGNESTQEGSLESSSDSPSVRDSILQTLDTFKEADTAEVETEGPSSKEPSKDEKTDSVEEDSTSESEFVAPQSWKKEEKEFFYTLPAKAQEAIVRREREQQAAFTRKTQELSQQKQLLDSVHSEFESLEREFQEPVNRVDFVKNAIQWDKSFRADPLRTWVALGQAYGLDVSKLTDSPELGRDTHLDQRIQELERTLEGFQNAHQTQVLTAAEQLVEEFKSEKNDLGSLKRPYFEDVKDEVETFLEVVMKREPELGARGWLEKAYELACYNNPDVRVKKLSSEQKSHQQKAANRVQSAIQQSKSIKTASSPNYTEPPSGSIRDTIRYTMRQLKGEI